MPQNTKKIFIEKFLMTFKVKKNYWKGYKEYVFLISSLFSTKCP